ncbi:10633_t:CDS:1, partial [Scutellospora calospora]
TEILRGAGSLLDDGRSSWDGMPYKAYPSGRPQLTVIKVTFPPHSQVPWHNHSMPIAGYVLSGELTIEKKAGGEIRRLKQGEVVTEMVGSVHRATSGDKPSVLIAFFCWRRRHAYLGKSRISWN